MYEEDYSDKLTYRRFPKVPIERRMGAFAIDFVVVWFVSSFFGQSGGWLVFLLGWLAMRIVVVDRNQGQSLGHYALDMKVIDYRYNRVPDLVTLAKREGILGFTAMLASLGLQNFGNGLLLLFLATPLLVDCLLALFDEDLDRAFHDRIAETIIIQTQRGFSLDLRLKKLLATIQRNMRQ
ncbi:conserved hypothetical protein [Hyella patelloides LEGE 07179]|uniref:RDD domain-containing protein n=1 Tax=Hyella patelloides LEGE 07179 TaxID=945734 RepID=A0A563VYT6_9CYAN|nr:RDD family protein [Hyella patelloides]VEP16590.1 conserved hypothetical protein [Hyella patelloides LEGE 07179]